MVTWQSFCTRDTVLRSITFRLWWQASFDRYEVWAAAVSWADWAIKATFSARLHSPGWCRHRSLPTDYQLQHIQWVHLRRQRMLCGTHTYETAWRSQPAEREERVCTGKWREKPIARQLDQLSPWPNQQEELFAFLTSKVAGLNWPPAKAVYVTSGPAVVSVGRRRTLELLWFTYSMLWSRVDRISMCVLRTQML